MNEFSYLKKVFRWNFLNKYHSNYEHLKFSKLLYVIGIKNWWHSQNHNIKKFVTNCSQCQKIQFSKISLKRKTSKHMINLTLQLFER